jgi:DNA-binding CsgD family transcriptional regulator
MLALADRPVAEAPRAAAPRPSAEALAPALLDQIDFGLLACTGEGQLLLANRAGRRELSHGRALGVTGSRLSCDPASRADFEQALREAVLRRRTRLLALGPEDDRLGVVVMPVCVSPDEEPLVLVMLGRRALCSPLGLQLLAIMHGLTLAEQRVLRALIDDRSAREIALDHGVALPTVRTQIQAIRDKIDVRSIDTLLLRAAQLPPVCSWQDLRPGC